REPLPSPRGTQHSLPTRGIGVPAPPFFAPIRTARPIRSWNIFPGDSVISDRCDRRGSVAKFLLWCILLVLCWPLAFLALILYPLIWLLLLPFRIIGVAVDA